MPRFSARRNFTLICLLALLAFGLGACGSNSSGGGGGGGSAASGDGDPIVGGTGRVSLLITDAPSDEFDAIEVSVSKIDLVCDDGRFEIFSGSETFDLLALQNFSNLFVVADNVPAGDCQKIRLDIDDLVLIRERADGTTEEIRPTLPAAGKLDLNPRRTFTIEPGGQLVIEIDMDAKRSIRVHETRAGEYRFVPVVVVRILDDVANMSKLARTSGEIREISESGDSLQLCALDVHFSDDEDSHADSDRQQSRCLQVNLFDDTTAFDANGDPVGLDQLMIDEEATIVGTFFFEGGGDSDSSDSDSKADSDSMGDSDSDSMGDSDSDSDSRRKPDLELDAIVVQLGPPGTFSTITGEVDTVVDATSERFDLLVDPNQGFVDGTVLAVQLQDGTAILTRNGVLLGEEEIQPGEIAEVDGVLQLSASDPDLLKAALVLLELIGPGESEFSGEISNLDPDARSFDLVSDDGTRCVAVREDAVILRIFIQDGLAMSMRVDLDELADGVRADVSGFPELGSCIDATVIVAFDEEVTPVPLGN